MKNLAKFIFSFSGVNILVKALPVFAVGTIATSWLFPGLSPNDLAKTVTLPVISAYLVIRLVDAGFAFVVTNPRDDDKGSDSEIVPLFCFTYGMLAFLISAATALAYYISDLEYGVEPALLCALASAVFAIASVIVIFHGGVQTKKPLDQAHDMIHSHYLFSHVGKQCHRRRAA